MKIPAKEAPKDARTLSSFVLICGISTACFGFVALLGWVADIPVLTTFGAERIPMAPSTALLFLLYGAGTIYVAHSTLSRTASRIVMIIGSAGALVSLLLFLLSSLGIHPEAEHLGLGISGTIGGAPVGHMSPMTAFCFLLAGLSFIAFPSSSASRTWRINTALGLSFILILTSFVLLIAYLLGLPLLYGTGIIPPALTTSLAFMLLGAGLFVSFLQRAKSPGKTYDIPISRTSHILAMIFVLMATGIITTGYLYSRHYEKNHRAEVEHQLSTIADMKVDELVRWREERLGDARLFYKNANFSALVRRYLQKPDDKETADRLRTWMRHVLEGHPYDRIFLLDAYGKERISEPEDKRPGSRHAAGRAIEFQRANQVVFEDFHRNENDGRVYLSVLVPILDEQGGGQALGTLVMRIDPELNLYPFIKLWPAPSRTAETLIVRRDGNDALFLNELRFKKGTALNLRIPLDKTDTSAVQAVLGLNDIMEGKDYRDVPVIAAVRTVPDSPWSLVARMDVSEVYAPVRERLRVMIALVIALLIGSASGVGLVWRQQGVNYFRKQYMAAEELRESEERYRSLFENMLNGFAHCKMLFENGRPTDFIYLDVNPAFEKLTGLKDVTGKKVTEVIPGIREADPALFEIYGNVALTGEPERFETHVEALKSWFSIAVYSPKKEYFVAIFDVITERKLAEKELRKHRDHLEELVEQRTLELKAVNKELEAFSYSVSHDLKTPLRAIDGFSNVMIEEYSGKLDNEGRRLLGIIRSSAQQMSQLIHDLLDFSRISRQQISESYIDMNALVRNILEELGPSLSGRKVELRINPLQPARGDRAMLRQALLNLLSNAAKFTQPRNEAFIEVGSTVKDSETVYFVKDNGVGFDMRYADKLFGVFQRLHSPEEFEGTGVGLAIVQRVIHRHGGGVWAEGRVNEGAVFYFSLPAAGSDVTGKQNFAVDTNKLPIRGGA